MPEVLTYRCPFCDRDARVGDPCPGCVAKEAKRPMKAAPAVKKRQPRTWESSASADFDDDEFDYEEFCKREFGKSPHHLTGMKWYWWCLAVIVLAGMTAGAVWFG